ncbi:DNA-processing protein DprA [Paenibacillus glufosinatiresistens]|uniref:DNA-processing protein DprA n=1 Tax=Paenibacillus glufosinatiresistens TaxID=3070657 RepID=UPI00286D6A62|nr:DNA-processing protein DprA [Paenibacillus sp. YX.27]
MNRSELLFGLHEMEGIGWASLNRIVRCGMLTEASFSCSEKEWLGIGLPPAAADRLAKQWSPDWIARRLELLEASGYRYLAVTDEAYPFRLREAAEPPWVLYLRGRTELLTRPSIAMVGTRAPTVYGRRVGEALASALSAKGMTVISGLARGIDSICHEAALPGPGGTIAVMATAIDKIYPPENRSLLRAIEREGLVVSEYPIGTKSHPGLFPRRNRIIAGLALGTVVVEADSRSGSLITADAALEAGRDVFAVPGPITSPKSRGSNDLLKQGAKLVSNPEDIWEEYREPWLLTLPGEGEGKADGETTGEAGTLALDENNLTSEESQLYHILHQGPFTFDELLGRSGYDFGLLHSLLLSLIIKKAVVQLPGAIYKIV